MNFNYDAKIQRLNDICQTENFNNDIDKIDIK